MLAPDFLLDELYKKHQYKCQAGLLNSHVQSNMQKTKESFDHQSMEKTIRRENTEKHILSDILILKEVGTLHFIMHKVL